MHTKVMLTSFKIVNLEVIEKLQLRQEDKKYWQVE